MKANRETILRTVGYGKGQVLAFADAGSDLGYPVLVQHGMIASISGYGLFRTLSEAGARVISLARPGYGDSSPYPMRDIGEWGEIVSVLVHELGLAEFDVLGISSGAPYAYASAHHLPARVRNLFILSGTPALYDDAIVAHWPYPVDRSATLPQLQALAHQLFFAGLSGQDLERPDNRDSMAHDCFGIAQDLKLRCVDWGFKLEEIRGRVYMRHSRADEAVPFVTAELTSRHLPTCHFEARAADPHFSPDVLDDFVRTTIAPRLGAAR